MGELLIGNNVKQVQNMLPDGPGSGGDENIIYLRQPTEVKRLQNATQEALKYRDARYR